MKHKNGVAVTRGQEMYVSLTKHGISIITCSVVSLANFPSLHHWSYNLFHLDFLSVGI